MEEIFDSWPFSPKPPRHRSFLQRIFRLRSREDAVIAINNLLASRRGLAELRPQEITGALDAFRVSAQKVRGDLQASATGVSISGDENFDGDIDWLQLYFRDTRYTVNSTDVRV